MLKSNSKKISKVSFDNPIKKSTDEPMKKSVHNVRVFEELA